MRDNDSTNSSTGDEVTDEPSQIIFPNPLNKWKELVNVLADIAPSGRQLFEEFGDGRFAFDEKVCIGDGRVFIFVFIVIATKGFLPAVLDKGHIYERNGSENHKMPLTVNAEEEVASTLGLQESRP